jgi:hypothetical protein
MTSSVTQPSADLLSKALVKLRLIGALRRLPHALVEVEWHLSLFTPYGSAVIREPPPAFKKRNNLASFCQNTTRTSGIIAPINIQPKRRVNLIFSFPSLRLRHGCDARKRAAHIVLASLGSR